MKHTLLFVDDEENILSSLSRLFQGEGYNIVMAKNAEEGLEKIADKELTISLVMSDHMMPGMKGVDFLVEVKGLAPDIVRIMLTGQADLGSTIEAINKGEVYRFITKPWNDDDLVLTIKQSLEYRELRYRNQHLTNIVKKHHYFIKKLEEHHPDITEVIKGSNGSIIIDRNEITDVSLEEIDRMTSEKFSC